MAKKRTVRSTSNKSTAMQPSGANRHLALYFFTLMREVLAQLQETGTQRDAAKAAWKVKKLLQEKTDVLQKMMAAAGASELDGLAADEKASKVLKFLYGLANYGYPSTYAAIACEVGVSEKQIMSMEAHWFGALDQKFDSYFATTRKEWLSTHPCGHCGAKVNEVHQAGCRGEECPFCHNLLSRCFCAYKHLKIRWGGKTAKEWRALQKRHGDAFNPRQHARPLTTEEERQWAAIVLQEGCIPYGSEQHFQ